MDITNLINPDTNAKILRYKRSQEKLHLTQKTFKTNAT